MCEHQLLRAQRRRDYQLTHYGVICLINYLLYIYIYTLSLGGGRTHPNAYTLNTHKHLTHAHKHMEILEATLRAAFVNTLMLIALSLCGLV